MSFANDPNLPEQCEEAVDWRRDALDAPEIDDLLEEGKAIGASNKHAFAIGALRVHYSRLSRALWDALEEIKRLKQTQGEVNG